VRQLSFRCALRRHSARLTIDLLRKAARSQAPRIRELQLLRSVFSREPFANASVRKAWRLLEAKV
jgi:hypothetical protein